MTFHPYTIQVKSVSKRFGSFQALCNISQLAPDGMMVVTHQMAFTSGWQIP